MPIFCVKIHPFEVPICTVNVSPRVGAGTVSVSLVAPGIGTILFGPNHWYVWKPGSATTCAN